MHSSETIKVDKSNFFMDKGTRSIQSTIGHHPRGGKKKNRVDVFPLLLFQSKACQSRNVRGQTERKEVEQTERKKVQQTERKGVQQRGKNLDSLS